MKVVTEYMPAETEKETEKMIDELRTLGMANLQMQLLQPKKKQNS